MSTTGVRRSSPHPRAGIRAPLGAHARRGSAPPAASPAGPAGGCLQPRETGPVFRGPGVGRAEDHRAERPPAVASGPTATGSAAAVLGGELPVVSRLFEGPYDIGRVLVTASGRETVSGRDLHLREGVVIRPAVERYSTVTGGRAIAKAVSPAYLTRKGGTEYGQQGLRPGAQPGAPGTAVNPTCAHRSRRRGWTGRRSPARGTRSRCSP